MPTARIWGALVPLTPERRPACQERRPCLAVERDADYVACFQALFAVGARLRKTGRNLPLLLQKARLELRMGSHGAAKLAAQDALKLDAGCQEAHWLHALSHLAICLEHLGLVDGGPGAIADEGPKKLPEDDLEDAHSSFAECARLSKWMDEEAVEYVDFTSNLLAARLTGSALGAALRPLLDLPAASGLRRLDSGRSDGR